MLLPVAYQNQFNSVYVKAYWLPFVTLDEMTIEASNQRSAFYNVTESSCLNSDKLSAQEKLTLSTITSPSVYHQKIWSFMLTRMVLSEVLQQDPKSIKIDRVGKPRLEVHLAENDGLNGSVYPTLHFNVSHSENLWIIAWSFEQEVGIDVQKIDTDINYQAIMRQFFVASEREKVKTVLDFFDIWTQKEAVLKCHGLSFAHIKKTPINNENLISLDIDSTFKAHLSTSVSSSYRCPH